MNLLHLRQLHLDAEVVFSAIDRSACLKIYPSCVEKKKLKKAMNELRQRGAFKVPKKCTYSETFYVLAKDKQDAEKKCSK